MGLHSEAELHRKFVEFAKLMNVYLNHFPRHERYGLALDIRRAAYDVYAMIVEAQKRYHKKTTLTNLDVRHEQLRMLLHLAHELGYFAFKDGARAGQPRRTAVHRHLAVSALVDELGRMIGGWIASERQREASCLSREWALECRSRIEVFLVGLKLEFSKSTLARVRRGVNFVGYRTWARKRFIRKHSLYKFRRALKHGRGDRVASLLGHARRTHSIAHLIRRATIAGRARPHAR